MIHINHSILIPLEKQGIHKNSECEIKWKVSEINKDSKVQSSRCGFTENGKILTRHTTLNKLLEADSATLKISNQKKGTMKKTLHHEYTDIKGAVRAIACRVHHKLINKGTKDNILCDTRRIKARTEVTSGDIVRAVRTASKPFKLNLSYRRGELTPT